MKRSVGIGLILLPVLLVQLAVHAEMVSRRWGKLGGTGAEPVAAKDAGGSAVPTGYAPLAGTPPEIDGKLTDACWAKAPAMALARTLDGTAAAARAAEARACRDEKNLYLAVRCAEPAVDKLKAQKREHDGEVWSDDSVEIFVGFSEKGQTYYHFGVNAAGSTYDGKVKDGAWNSLFKAAAAKGDKEWSVELAIPLDKLAGGGTGSKPVPTEWIINFNRNRYAGGELEETAWSPTLSGDSHTPARFGKLLLAEPPGDKSGPASTPAAPAGPEGLVKVLPVKEGAGIVRFDLSDLPKDTKVYRANLLVTRTQAVTGADDEAQIDIEIYPLFGGTGFQPVPEQGTDSKPVPPEAQPLKLLPPWFDRFDATEAVKGWLSGKPNGGFHIKAGPFIDPSGTCLDVFYEVGSTGVWPVKSGSTGVSPVKSGGTGSTPVLPQQVTDVQSFHRAGQTFITWKEIDDPVGADDTPWGKFRPILENLDKSRQLRYCVYRSDKPIVAGNLHEAVCLASVAPLSGWNINARSVDKAIDDALANQYYLNHHQWNPFAAASMDGKWGTDCLMERLVIRDGQPPLARGTGLYVHTVSAKGKAYYAVVTSVDGVENTLDISGKNAPPQGVEETEGAGEPVLQKEFPPKPYFNYHEQRLHYVTWVAPPQGNLPSQYYNWSVGVPLPFPPIDVLPATQPTSAPTSRPARQGMPVELSLHRDGRSYYRTQYRVETDSLVISPHDFPIKTWWYGYHESLGTLKSFKQGAVHNYTERRLLAFLDWAAKKWPVDRSRILVTGCAGGAAGAGAIHLGVRHPEVFSLVLSGYGVADYAGEMQALAAVKRAGSMPKELESIWGKVAWACRTDGGKNVWDEVNCTKLVSELPAKVGLPMLTITGHGILKPMRDFYVAMLEHGQPFMCRYGVYGGGTLLPISRTGLWTNMIRMDLAKDLPVVAFFGSVESRPLWQEPKEPAGELVVSDHILRWWGEYNIHSRWKNEDLVDEPARFEITLYLAPGSRDRKKAVDVTIRQVKNFRVRPDWQYNYELRGPGGELIDQGKVEGLDKGCFVIRNFNLTPEGVRVIIKP